MKSQDLVNYIYEHQVFRALKVDVQEGEIWKCGNLAQSEILRECEILEEYPSATFIATKGIYTSANTGWEFLLRTVRVKSGVNAASPFGVIISKSKDWVDEQRRLVADGNNKPKPPKYLYHLLTNPISVGFWGEPDDASAVNLVTVRGHGAADNLSDSVHPLIPIGYDDLMVIGTIAKLLRNRMTFEGTSTSRGKFIPDRFSAAYQFAVGEFNARKLEVKLTRTTIGAQYESTGRLKMG